MRISITTDEGELIDVIEDVEQYDLRSPIASTALVEEIRAAVQRGLAKGEGFRVCKRCGSPLDKDGWCTDVTCPHADWAQCINVERDFDADGMLINPHLKVWTAAPLRAGAGRTPPCFSCAAAPATVAGCPFAPEPGCR